jgi:uncharacterized protein
MTEHRRVQFVVKVSKHCNLRCRYCYEYEELGNKQRMAPEQLERLFANVASWHRGLAEPTQVEFVWHGGEPLLQPPEYYFGAFDAQRRLFGDQAFALRNVVQTNLTVLDDERVRLLRDGFDGVGVSIDLFGGLRVNAAGEDSVPKVLANLDRLRKENVDFGCITVLTSKNLSAIPKIIAFYDALKVSSVRILPLFDGAFEGQHQGYEIDEEQVLSGFKAIFEELLARDSSVRVEPIHQYVNQVLHHHTPGASRRVYDKRTWEPIYVVNLNGDLYSYAETYEPGFCHGNLFEQPLAEIVGGPGHLQAVAAAEARMGELCHKCRFFGSCDGYPVAEAAGRHRETYGATPSCRVEKGIHEYLEQRLMELGVIDPISLRVTMPAPRASFKHIDELPLQREVQIRCADEDREELAQRLSLSAGTMCPLEPPGDGLSYLKAAIVPKEPWRALLPEESALLFAPTSSAWNVGSDLGVFRIPDEVIAPLEAIFEQYGTRDCLDSATYQVHTLHPDWDAAYQRLIEHLTERYALRQHEPTVVRLATAPPGMKTVTKDSVKDRSEHYYVGMHLDTWEKIPLLERHKARNRICVNLGREDRYFLFMNLTLMKMFEALGREDPARADDYYGTDLGHDFMRTFPGYPVLKLRVRPREAYIAPTDNLIHDGSSTDKRYPDIALHILGYFGMLAERASTPLRPEHGAGLSVP